MTITGMPSSREAFVGKEVIRYTYIAFPVSVNFLLVIVHLIEIQDHLPHKQKSKHTHN
jgi:hypothetical protein